MLREKIYVYSGETGEFLCEKDGKAQAEKDLGLYRNSIYEYIKGIRKAPVKGYVFSIQKLDKFPLPARPSIKRAKTEAQPKIMDIVSPVAFLSEEDLRKKHDMLYIVKSELAQIQKGMFVEETKLIRKLGFYGKVGFRAVIDHPEVRSHKGKADGMIYYGHPESISKLKSEGVLS